jgi:hypothetical protein
LPRLWLCNVVTMRSDAGGPDFSWDLQPSNFQRGATEWSDPAVAVVQRVAETIMETAGPLFWAVLVVGFVTDVLGVSFLR